MDTHLEINVLVIATDLFWQHVTYYYFLCVDYGHVPQKIKYTPVIDEVEAEADDESSEVDEQEDEEIAIVCCTGTSVYLVKQAASYMFSKTVAILS